MLNFKKKLKNIIAILILIQIADEAIQASSSKHLQLSVPLLESAISDQQLGLAPSTSASSEQSCFSKQSELQVEPATTEQSEEPYMT